MVVQVLYKHQLELDVKKKKALDKQLEFLLGQTERYFVIWELFDYLPVTFIVFFMMNNFQGRSTSADL